MISQKRLRLTTLKEKTYHRRMRLSAALSFILLGPTHAFIALQSSSTVSLSETSLYARKAFITGNWKLNPQTKAEAVDLARGIASAVNDYSQCDVAIFVPFPFIESVKGVVGDRLVVGAEVR